MNYRIRLITIGALEKQSGILRILVFLYVNEEYMLSNIWRDANIPINSGYEALRKAKDLSLVQSRTDSSSYPPKNMISLTEKGKRVAEYLKRIEEIL